MMWFKILVVLVVLVILGALVTGMVSLIRDTSNSDKTVKALTWRIGLSVGLFVLLFIGAATGLIQPHGVFPQAQQENVQPE